MNYLAHLFLSPNQPHIITGNFLADRIQAKRVKELDFRIQKGIQLHRWIDNTTDHHPIFMKHRKSLYPLFSKYAGVVLDVMYDHLLMLNWDILSQEKYSDFEDRVVTQLQKTTELLNERESAIINGLVEKRWIRLYADKPGMDRIFARLNGQLKFPIAIDQSMGLLAKFIPQWKEDHLVFMQPFLEERSRWANLSFEVE